MKPSKLIHYIETKPSVLKDTLLQFFKRKKCEQEEQKQLLKATTSSNVSALRASFLVADCKAEAKKPFTLGEELIPLRTFVRNFLDFLPQNCRNITTPNDKNHTVWNQNGPRDEPGFHLLVAE